LLGKADYGENGDNSGEIAIPERCWPVKSALPRSARPQLAARGTKERARLGWPFFGRENIILKNIMFREITTVLNERAYLKMVIRLVPDAVRLILGRTE
jgi:hypothetical protein